MARSRTHSDTTTTERTTKMAAGITQLDASAIAELLAKSKQRGEYARQMKDFLDSGAAGVQISLTEGVFQGKKAASVKAGFENTKSGKNAVEGASSVRVIQDGENVFLVNQGETD